MPPISPERYFAEIGIATAGQAARLLLVLLRRLPADDPSIEVFGDTGLLAQWLAQTAF
jgi:hypothetical protein